MYIQRNVLNQIKKLKKGFPVVVITGPRQSGKTTFLINTYPSYKYFNLEDPLTLQFIKDDVKQFFHDNPKNIIIDEIQRFPELLSYIQVHVDKNQEMGSLLLSGSQNLLISEKVSQSLAGRAGYQVILPFDLSELKKSKLLANDRYDQIIKGGYPSIYTRDITPELYFKQYISTYTERDVRQMRNISELSQFQKFMTLLSGRVGQVLNVSSLATDTGISPNTAEDWISILEASYIIYRIQPYFKNVNKRVIKSPKLYFYDTGLLTTLLRIRSREDLIHHYLLGSIFENFIISELLKLFTNKGIQGNLFFYRDNHGNEVDLLLGVNNKYIPIEIKHSASYSADHVKGINYWNQFTNQEGGIVIYGGEKLSVKGIELINWSEIDKLVEKFTI